MSADALVETRGRSATLGAFVVGAAFDRAGALAFGLGDGTLALPGEGGDEWARVAAHEGAVLAFTADAAPTGWLSGGDDGRLLRSAPDGTVSEIAAFGMKWVEQVATFADGKAAVRAAGVGRNVHLFDGAGALLRVLDHPSTVTGLAFDGKGKRIAASHYNGASVWFVASRSGSPRRLEWKGSHTGVALSPDGENVVSAMQENALHGWRLADGQHMRMSGYPTKPRALSFTRNSRWMASSGAESVVCWPFFGGGPMGKPPVELAGGDGVLCTVVACHPQADMVAAGFADGLVVLAEIASGRVVPVAGPAPARGPVSALAWDGAGARLAFGTEGGFAALVDLSKR